MTHESSREKMAPILTLRSGSFGLGFTARVFVVEGSGV